MKSISQIGKAALSRIFKPEQKFELTYRFERTVKFMQDDGSIKIPHYEHGVLESGKPLLSTDFKVWSIELGLQEVDTNGQENLYKAIYKNYSTKPTHIIVIHHRMCHDFDTNYVTKNDDVCIYRVDMSLYDISFEEAMQEETDRVALLTSTGNGSWA